MPPSAPGRAPAADVWRILNVLEGTPALVGVMLCGAGLRRREALQRRVKDVDLGRRALPFRVGKGGKRQRTVPAEWPHIDSKRTWWTCGTSPSGTCRPLAAAHPCHTS